jgi:hypothetical protein
MRRVARHLPSCRIVALGAALAVTSCGGALERAAPVPAAALAEARGTAELRVHDRLAWPYELEELTVALDGVVLHRGGGDARRPLARLDLEPGDHTLEVRAVVRYSAALLGDESCRVEARREQGVRVGWEPASVAVVVGLRDAVRPFLERVALGVELAGAQPIAWRAVPHPPHEVLAPGGAETIERAARARLEQARRDGDVERVLCYEAKLEELRTFARLHAQRLAARAAERAGPDGEARAAHETRVARVLEQRLARLWGETNACVNGGSAFALDATSRSLTPTPACGGTDPADPFERTLEARR